MAAEKSESRLNKGGSKNGGFEWSILEHYEKDRRQRIDSIKRDLNKGWGKIGGLSIREQKEINVEPRLWRKIGRTALDAVNLHPPASERRRQQEALAVARAERKAEREEAVFQREMEDVARQIGDDVSEMILEKNWKERDRKQLEREMVDRMDVWRSDERARYESERKQEFLERDLNDKLVTVDELEEQVEIGSSEVSRRYMEFDGKEILVYDLKGLPFAMLSHSIEYKDNGLNKDNISGVATSRILKENPGIWRQRDDEFDVVSLGSGARGNTISVSYINSEHNLNTRYGSNSSRSPVCYGFEHVEGDSILANGVGDLASTNNFGKMRGATHRLFDWEVLESMPIDHSDFYNEVVLRRYGETGKPRLPDYIIAQNGTITVDMLKHAAAFDIPVVNIEEKFYNEKFRARAEEILASVTKDNDYQEVLAALHEIGSLGPYRSAMKRINWTALSRRDEAGRRAITDRDFSDSFSQKLVGLVNLELEKRISFIADVLQDEIKKVQQATERGGVYEVTQVDDISVDKFKTGVGECLSIDMKLKGDSVGVKTIVYEDDGFNGEVYTSLAPLVEEYAAVVRDNSENVMKSRKEEYLSTEERQIADELGINEM